MADPPQPDFALLREQMVNEQLRARGVRDERVLEAILNVPRERFVPPDCRLQAYEDRALPIGLGQTISQPYMVGAMTAVLRLESTHRVLEIGTGSGYQTAILSRLAREVYTIERLPELADRARTVLDEVGCQNVFYRVGDGTLGWPEHAPFDRILVTAGAPEIPRPLVDQLAEGGLLVIPVGHGPETLTVVERWGDRTVERPVMSCRFVPLVGQAGWSDGTPSTEDG